MIESRKLAGGWKILLPVRVQAIYGMQAATFLNARTFPAVFVDSMPNHSKQSMRDTELEVFDDLHVVRRNDDAEIAQPGHLSAFEPGQPDVESTRFARSEEHTSELQSLAYLVCR